MDADEARDVLGVSSRTLKKMVKDGRLTARTLASGRQRYKVSEIRAIVSPPRDRAAQKRITVTVEGITHGLGGYTNHKCRCDVCRKARSSYVRAYRNSPDTDLPPDDTRHGKRSTYIMRGCKCDLCKEAVRQYARGRQEAIRQERGWAEL